MTRSITEIDQVLLLFREGRNQCEIARRTGIPRGTVNDWVNGRIPRDSGGHQGARCPGCDLGAAMPTETEPAYAYLLGMYLGDGCISRAPRGVFRLRITLDRAYPQIVAECAEAMQAIVPTNRVLIYPHPKESVEEVSMFWKHWPCLFPQHGIGRKHERPIDLAMWQRAIADRHPWQFLRGLIHSDGCRFMNTIRHPKKAYRYPRYNFSNRSDDIRGLFCEYCDKVDVEWRRMNRWDISVARRESVALMDRHIGPKH